MLLFKAVIFIAVSVVFCQAAKSDLDLAETSGNLDESYNYDYYDSQPKSPSSVHKAQQADVLVTTTTTKKPKSKEENYDDENYDYKDDYKDYKDDYKDDKNPKTVVEHEFIPNQPTTPTTPEPPLVTSAPMEAETETTRRTARDKLLTIISKPGILAGIVGGAIIGVLTAILLIMFIVYRMKKKDEGSYALEETKKPLNAYDYRNCPTKEFYA